MQELSPDIVCKKQEPKTRIEREAEEAKIDIRSEWETQDEIDSAAEEERPDMVWKMEELRAEIGCKNQY